LLSELAMTTPEEITAVFQRHTEHRLQLEELMLLFPQVLPENLQTLDMGKIDILINFIKNVVNHETGSMVVSRQLVNIIISRLEGEAIEGAVGAYGHRCEPVESNLLKLALVKLLGVLQPRAISYEDQLAQVSFKLAGIFEREGNNKQAAFYLRNMNLEQAQRGIAESEKCDIYLRTARLYLEADEAEEAEKVINRVSLLLQNKDKKDDELTLTYKALFARILDSRRRFLEAAGRFYELANSQLLPHSDRMEALGSAITSVLLAPPGATRTRMLIQLYKDERSTGTKSFQLLEKTYLCRIIKTQEIAEFENSLLPHQKTNEAGENIVRNVLIEHNVIASSRIYGTISLKSLGDLLGLENEEAAEMVAAEMIADKRLDAHIDQIHSKIIFKHTNPIKKWDEHIGLMCGQVSKVYDSILSLHPEFVQSVEDSM
ncbi:hypothetical protein PENTCL1PPCAC_17803, partial [Pristionchus entomophagus]